MNLSPEFFGPLIPIAALSIPVIKILTKHQAQMAQIIHSQSQQQQGEQQDTSELREEVRQLRELMHQQTIALDNLRDDIRSSKSGVQDRLSENS